MYQPAYKLNIDGKVIDTTDDPKASTVTHLNVKVSMDAAADSCHLSLGAVSSFIPKPGDSFKLDLGYTEGSLTRVFTGTVVQAGGSITQLNIIAHGAAHTLQHRRMAKTFEDRSAGAVVRALASQAGVNMADVRDGNNFPAYVVDERRDFFTHMHLLAALNDFDLYLDARDRLIFKAFSGGKRHDFQFAKHILGLSYQETDLPAAKVSAYGEGSADSSGKQAWAWLTKDFKPYAGSYGSGENAPLLERPALRGAQAAQTAAKAAAETLRRNGLWGSLLLRGYAAVQLGDAIALQDLPHPLPEDLFQIRNIHHRLCKRAGFTTTVHFRSI